MTDLTDHLADERTKRVQAIIEKADFTKCQAGPEMKEVYAYIISCLAYMVGHQSQQKQQSELTLLGGRLLSMSGIAITGRDVVLLVVIATLGLVAAKDLLFK